MYEYKVADYRVIDGDTVEVTLDLGFFIHHTVVVRILGINCPEKNDERWSTARVAVAEWFGAKQHVVLRTFRDRTGKYGRYLGDFIGSDSTLAGMLLERGLAEPYGV